MDDLAGVEFEDDEDDDERPGATASPSCILSSPWRGSCARWAALPTIERFTGRANFEPTRHAREVLREAEGRSLQTHGCPGRLPRRAASPRLEGTELATQEFHPRPVASSSIFSIPGNPTSSRRSCTAITREISAGSSLRSASRSRSSTDVASPPSS